MSLQRNRDTLDYWLNGIPVIIPGFDGSFNAWINGIADVDRGSQAGASSPFGTTTGVAGASARLSGLAGLSIHGIGIALGSAIPVVIPPSASATGYGAALGSARLNFLLTPWKGYGVSLGSAKLSSYPALLSQGISTAVASASLSHFISVVIGPPLPSYAPIRESVPQLISMFGFIMQPILDVLKLRYVPLNYVSPPVCQPANSIASGSAFSIPTIL